MKRSVQILHSRLVWRKPLAPSVTTSSTDFSFQNLVFWNLFEFQNGETQHVNIVLQCIHQFFEQPNMKGNHA